MSIKAAERAALSFYENRERYLTEQLLSQSPNIKEIHFTKPEERKFYDGWYEKTNGAKIYFEVKVRDFHMNNYPDYIMEKKKLENLLGLVSRKQNVAYINIFTTPHKDTFSAILFSLNARYKEWIKSGIPYQTRWMAQQTFKSRSKKCSKEVIMMKYECGKDYKVDRFSIKKGGLDLLK